MYYAPHILQKQVSPTFLNDELGRPVVNGEPEWENVCECRADENSALEFTDENGNTFRPDYHVVCGDRKFGIYGGEHVRVLWKDTGDIKCEGKAIRTKHLNYLNYGDFWVQV